MQSTLTLQEEELARSLKAQGRSTQDIMGAIAKQRTGGIDKAQSMSGSTLGRVATDVPSDFMELGRNVIDNVDAGGQKLTDSLRDPSATPIQKAASVLPILGQSVLNVAGGAAVDVGKMLTTDEFEKAVSSKIGEAGSAVMDTSAAKGLAAWYDRQDDATKFNIKNIFLPVGEVVGEVATAGVGAGATRAASGAISRGVTNAGEELTSLARDIARPPVTAPIQTPLPPEVKATIVKGFDVAIKPNLSSKKTPVQLGRYNEQVARSIDTITNNRANLSYVDDATGETVTGRLPENLKEYVDALEQTKQTIFQQYDDIAAKAGEVGAQVDTIAVANQLDEILNSKSLKLSNPEAIRYAEEVRGRLLSTKNLSTVDAQDVIRNYNKSLEAFYRNPTPEGLTRNAVDAMVANNLRKALDDEIAGITGAQYQALKSDYASLKTVERDIMRAFNRDARRNTKGLIDFTDVFTGGQVVSGILSMNPAIIGQGLAGKALSTAIKVVNDPNRKVKQIFQEAGRYERPDAGANTPARRQLPAAQPNAPRSEVSGGRTMEVGGQTERGQVTAGITERTREGAIRQPDGEAVPTLTEQALKTLADNGVDGAAVQKAIVAGTAGYILMTYFGEDGIMLPAGLAVLAAMPNRAKLEALDQALEINAAKRSQATGATATRLDQANTELVRLKEIELGKDKSATTQTTLLEEAKKGDGAKASGQMIKMAKEAPFRASDFENTMSGQRFFHGSASDFDEFDTSKFGKTHHKDFGEGISLASNEKSAQSYKRSAIEGTDSKGFVKEFYIDPAAKSSNYYKTTPRDTSPGLGNKLRKEGYDVLYVYDELGGVEEVLVMNPKVIYNPAQLTDIWKQANQ